MADGFFISLDGVDGCGKSTQCQLLADWLHRNSRSVTQCTDPGGTDLGFALRDLLLHTKTAICPMSEALLFMASRAQLIHEVIQPALRKGDIVVCDRFLLSTVVYQGYAGKLNPEQVYSLCKQAANGLEPDLTVVLDLPLEIATKRMPARRDRIEQRGTEYFELVRQGFLSEAKKRPDRITVIDASAPIETVHEAIREIVSRKVCHVRRT